MEKAVLNPDPVAAQPMNGRASVEKSDWKNEKAASAKAETRPRGSANGPGQLIRTAAGPRNNTRDSLPE
jgi:hypothetical protein